MTAKSKIMDKEAIERALKRISHEILEQNDNLKDLVIVGIKLRGDLLAQRLKKNISQISGIDILVGSLDITLYRDDLTQVAEQPIMRATEIDFDVTGKIIILADDVLYTGRTIRCALDALIDLGRPKAIQLAVLVDRGHRELPIRADYVGKNVPTATNETVEVRVEEADKIDEVVIVAKGK